MTKELPQVTPEHAAFGRRIAAIGQIISGHAISEAMRRFGDPPTDLAREDLQATLQSDLYFASPEDPSSPPSFEGSIAGSDSFAISCLLLPQETMRNIDPAFPGRLMDIELQYGATQKWGGRLFSGPETPPIIVGWPALKAAWEEDENRTKLDESHLSFLGVVMDRVGEDSGAFIYPTADELRLILGGLEKCRNAVDFPIILGHCAQHLVDLDDAGEAWFEARVQELGS